MFMPILFLMLLAMDVMEPVPSVCRDAEAGVEGGERGREGERVCADAVTSSVEPK
jgi:hypothetical protein